MEKKISDNIELLNNSSSIPEVFFERCKKFPEEVFAKIRYEDEVSGAFSYWDEVLLSDVSSKILKLSNYLKSLQLEPKARIAIISNSRIEWLIADLAILTAGYVSVSVYQSLLPKDMAYILYDSDTKVIFAENQEQIDKIEQLTSSEWEIPETEDRQSKKIKLSFSSVISFEKSGSSNLPLSMLEDIFENLTADFEFSKDLIQRDDLASLVYTSGTTGAPKGVMQTHGNHLSNVRQVLESGLMIPGASIFLFLPLAHSFAKLMGFLAGLTDISVTFPEISDKTTSKLKPGIIMRDMSESKSEIYPIVPRFLEKIKDQLYMQSERKDFSSKMVKATINNALDFYSSPSLSSRFLYALLSPMRSIIRNKLFGSNFKYCVSGGAKLSTSVHIFFEALGIHVYEGYGLTETVVATNAGRPGANKIGSVGKVLAPDIEMKIIEGGEIAFKGPNVSPGYLNRPKATEESWTKDGWFLTGDTGEIDAEGFLFIKGRKKEIIVTSGGKNVAPVPIEEKLMDSPLISQAVVVGDGRKFCSAILTINKEAVLSATSEDSSKPDINNPNECKITQEKLWEHIDKVNSLLSSYETIKKIFVLSEEFSVENGLLTPSMKIKRKKVEDTYKDQIDTFYS